MVEVESYFAGLLGAEPAMEPLERIPETADSFRLGPRLAETFEILFGEALGQVQLEMGSTYFGRAVGARRFLAITFGERIYFSRSGKRVLARGDARALAFLGHELFHVCQVRGHGGLALFLVRYLASYLRYRLLGYGDRRAYRSLGLELGAFQAQEHLRNLLDEHPEILEDLRADEGLGQATRAALEQCAGSIRKDAVCGRSLSWCRRWALRRES